jgi:hypothetical protein
MRADPVDNRIQRGSDRGARRRTVLVSRAAGVVARIWPAAFIACGGEDQTHLLSDDRAPIAPEPGTETGVASVSDTASVSLSDTTSDTPPLADTGSNQPAASNGPVLDAVETGPQPAPETPSPPPSESAPSPGEGTPGCAPSVERALRLRWSEPAPEPGCTYFSAPRVDLVPPPTAFELGDVGRLTQTPDGLELQLGSSSFLWREGGFHRKLECAGPQSTPGGARAWQVVESLQGSWTGGSPLEACADQPLRFAGRYEYGECELQSSDRSCLRGARIGDCAALAAVELDVLAASEATPGAEATGEALPGAAACRPVLECEGDACVQLGQRCTRDIECVAGSFCERSECSGAGTCRELPSLDECRDGDLLDVCGCDGIPYSSPCLAHYYSTSVRGAGACTSPAD